MGEGWRHKEELLLEENDWLGEMDGGGKRTDKRERGNKVVKGSKKREREGVRV